MNQRRFAKFAWGLLAYNILVVLWGAYVRASRSGDGCGTHWPTCGGEVLPSNVEHTKTWVEFAHRVSTGILGPVLILFAIWAFRAFAKRHPVRYSTMAVVGFTVIEAWIGMHLVTNGLVAGNVSVERAFWLSLHLVNTFALIAALALTAWWASGHSRIQLRGQGAMGFAIIASLLMVMGLAVTGAIAALGDTVFPADPNIPLLTQIKEDFSATAHYLMKARPPHAFTAMTVGLWVLLISGLCGHLRPSPQTKYFLRWTASLFLFQMAFGLVNLFYLAPVVLQIGHLLIANALWISLVLLSASALAVDCRRVEMEPAPVFAPVSDQSTLTPKDIEFENAAIAATANPAEETATTWKDYLALTKPRVISLLLFTTLTAMVIGKQGWPGWWLFIATALGLYMAAGAANAINMVCERDLDIRMARTATRPTLTDMVPAPKALWFAFALATGSFGLLWSQANLLAALMALSGLVVYVIVYTLLLKRRTWSNIVIGGAAGAFPPLVGYAAVTNSLDPLAWCLFGLIFVWTPVHFWALALLIKDDYARAGVPMLPVVMGDRHTVLQISLYALATVAISLFPFVLHEGHFAGFGLIGAGWIYLGAVVLLNAILLWRSVQLFQNPTRPRASSVFHYSMLYLALLFLALALDRSLLA
ncbi:MAG: heme o synthase [Abditibacteriota bacterium]|nr:heme o synthase [Abditibacteriota bacterium]